MNNIDNVDGTEIDTTDSYPNRVFQKTDVSRQYNVHK